MIVARRINNTQVSNKLGGFQMTTPSLITIPARKGKAAFVARGQSVRVINTHGQQVVDTWAFRRDDLSEFMSMEHSRTSIGRIMPAVGQSMTTNHRRPILTLAEDTSGGIHDTLIAACDRYRYELLGCEGYHDNCTDNLAAALAELGLTPPETPSPWNLFHEHPRGNGWLGELRAAGVQAGRPPDAPRGNGLRHRVFRVPAGHGPHQR